MPEIKKIKTEKPKTICYCCGKKIKVKENKEKGETISCNSKKCNYKVIMLKDKLLKRIICLSNECKGNTIMIAPPDREVKKCSKCKSDEVYEMEDQTLPSFFSQKPKYLF